MSTERILELAAKVLAVVTGIASIVLVSGGFVITLRMLAADLPPLAGVSQLPSEQLMAVGVGQVALPAVLAGVGYCIYRFIRGEVPVPTNKKRIILLAVILLAMPAAAVVLGRHLSPWSVPPEWPSTNDLGNSIFWLSLVVLLIAWAFVVYRLRARMIRWNNNREVSVGGEPKIVKQSWNEPPAIVAMAGVYVLATIPAIVAAGAFIALPDAKVCSTLDFEERGSLVSSSSDAVVLGEPLPRDRRLAIIPTSQINQLFVGPGAGDADCDFGDARVSLIATERSRASQAAADQASRAWEELMESRLVEDVQDLAESIVSATTNAGLAALEVADAAQLLNLETSSIRAAGWVAIEAVKPLQAALVKLRSEAYTFDQLIAEIGGPASDAASAGLAAAVEADRLAAEVLEEALRRQPSS